MPMGPSVARIPSLYDCRALPQPNTSQSLLRRCAHRSAAPFGAIERSRFAPGSAVAPPHCHPRRAAFWNGARKHRSLRACGRVRTGTHRTSPKDEVRRVCWRNTTSVALAGPDPFGWDCVQQEARHETRNGTPNVDVVGLNTTMPMQLSGYPTGWRRSGIRRDRLVERVTDRDVAHHLGAAMAPGPSRRCPTAKNSR